VEIPSQKGRGEGLKKGQARPLEAEATDTRAIVEKALKEALKKIEAAFEENTKKLQKQAENMVAFCHRLNEADFYYQRGDFEKALSGYESALKLNPSSPSVWDSRGMALANLGRLQEALEAHIKATELDPEFAKAWNNQGVALADLKRYQEALAAYNTAIKLDPGFANAWYNMALTSAVLGDKERMLAGLKKVLLLDSGFKEAAMEDFEPFLGEKDLKALLE
jgi:tetratricopeptide (TPR) repeat protein